MTRLYEPAAYARQPGNFWASTRDATSWPPLTQDMHCDVAVIGGGFTGLNAALTLAQRGISVTVLEAEHPGYGASGRNGGFCCEGGSKLPVAAMRHRYGPVETALWQETESAAITHVRDLLHRHDLTHAIHGEGEVCLAHSPRAARAMQGQDGFVTRDTLHEMGLGGPWHGGIKAPHGFPLNPQQYHDGLAEAAQSAGATLFADSPVTALTQTPQGWQLTTAQGRVTADRVILATNGYSSETLPPWLRARTMPAQSSVIVTRPLSLEEQQAAGYTVTTMAYDSRVLLHYFRLMPDGRFLFGMRGGLTATARAQTAISRKIRADFRAMFPAWQDVEITHEWSGLVCLLRHLHPFMGPVPDHPGLFAALGYHGNGVAMGSYLGHCLGLMLADEDAPPLPRFLSDVPRRFPLGLHRRVLMRPAYLAAQLLDL